MQNKLATLPSNLPMPKPSKDVESYYSPSSWRRWELSIGWKTKIYLTDEEREYYLKQLKLGKKIILIGEMVLTKQFNYIIPIRNKSKPSEYGEIRYY